MHARILLTLIASAILYIPCLAQKTDDIQQLMNEREALFREWKEHSLERNALFGGRSKNDLRNVIESQQRIIELDSKIFHALRSHIPVDTQNLSEKNKVLFEQLDSLRTVRQKVQRELNAITKREQVLQARIDKLQISNRNLSVFLVLTIILFILAIFYISSIRQRKKSQ